MIVNPYEMTMGSMHTRVVNWFTHELPRLSTQLLVSLFDGAVTPYALTFPVVGEKGECMVLDSRTGRQRFQASIIRKVVLSSSLVPCDVGHTNLTPREVRSYA